MARQAVHIPLPGKQPAWYSRQKEWLRYADENAVYNRAIDNNLKVDRRRDLQKGLGVEGFDGVFDRYVDAEEYLGSGAWQGPLLAAAGLGTAAVAGAGYLGARNQQQVEGLPTDPLSVAGRMANGYSVGTDPLAAARLNVQEAERQVGSQALLAALVDDQITGQESVREVNTERQISAAIEEIAQAMMADGRVEPDVAYREARNAMELQLRQEGNY